MRLANVVDYFLVQCDSGYATDCPGALDISVLDPRDDVARSVWISNQHTYGHNDAMHGWAAAYVRHRSGEQTYMWGGEGRPYVECCRCARAWEAADEACIGGTEGACLARRERHLRKLRTRRTRGANGSVEGRPEFPEGLERVSLPSLIDTIHAVFPGTAHCGKRQFTNDGVEYDIEGGWN